MFIDNIKNLSHDSLSIHSPIFSSLRSEGTYKTFFSLPLNDRPEKVREKLKIVLYENLPKSTLLFSKKDTCEKLILTSLNLARSPELFLKRENFCIPMDSLKYNFIIFFAMNVGEASFGMSTEWSFIHVALMVFYKNELVFHKQLFDHLTSRRSHFPKHLTDRTEFPYFPPKQIDRVVNGVAKEILRKLE